MKGRRLLKNGQRTLKNGQLTSKQKPGPKPQSVADSDDRNLLIFMHALHKQPALRAIFTGLSTLGGVGRQHAKISLLVVEAAIQETVKGENKQLGLLYVARTSGQVQTKEQLSATADLLVKKHRAVMRDRARTADRAYLDKYADLLHLAALPRRAANVGKTVVSTPAGLSGGGAWATKRAIKAASRDALPGEPAWISAARLGACYLAGGADESTAVAGAARDDLRAIGFRVDLVFKRLGLMQSNDGKEKISG